MSTELAELQTRFLALDAPPAPADDALRVELSFSSEEPVERGGFWEVLGHGPGEVNLEWFNSGRAPFLADHRNAIGAVLGRVVRADLRGGKGRAVVEFGQHPEAQEALAKLRDGLLGNISVGYTVEKFESAGELDGQPRFRATRWTPREISLVATPADVTVGVGRSSQPVHSRLEMPDIPNPPAAAPASPPAPPLAMRAAAGPSHLERERERTVAISQLGAQFADRLPEAPKLAADAIQAGRSYDAFRGDLLDAMGRDATLLSNSVMVHLSERDRRDFNRFSLGRAVRAVVESDWSEAGLEREVAQEMARQAKAAGRTIKGLAVPLSALAERAPTNLAAAPGLVGEVQATDSFIDVLRPAAISVQLGAKLVGGLSGKVSIPRLAQGAVPTWAAEDTAVGESVATADAVVLEPNTVGASVYLTRALVKQSLLSVEAIVAADLRAQLGVAMDRAVMGGLNLAAAPAGIIDAVGVHKVTLTTADKPTWAQVVDLVSKVEGANVGYGAFGWALAPAMAGYLRANPKVSGDSAMMMTDMTLVAHKVAISSNVPTGLLAGPGLKFSGAIFGDWSSVVIGSWDGLDLQVDPYSAGRKGGIYLTALMDVDVGVKQPKAFALAYNP